MLHEPRPFPRSLPPNRLCGIPHNGLYVQDAIMLSPRPPGRVCPAQRGSRWRDVQHNQRLSRKARSASGGRYLPGLAPRGAVRAIACSLSAGSACSGGVRYCNPRNALQEGPGLASLSMSAGARWRLL